MMKKGDIYIIVAALVIAAFVFAGYRLYSSGDGSKTAVIIHDGKIVRTIDLASAKTAQEIEVKGEFISIIQIADGRIRFETTDCPNKDCVKTGWISEKGQLAVCLPNKVIIKIEGSGEQIDGGTY